MKFENTEPPGVRSQFRLIFNDLTYILVGMLVAHEKKRRARDPERTRERLLQAAFREIHRSGFQSAGIDTILAATNVTKGALYYHFDSKEALGYAVVEEIIANLTRDRWLRPMLREGQPIDILIGVVRRIPARPEDVRGGCPLLNLAQEMSPLDEQFRKRLERIFLEWQEGVATLLRRGPVPGNSSPRLGSRPDRQLSGRDGRGLRYVSKECSRCEGVESGNQKYRGVAEVSSRAGQPQAGLIASIARGLFDAVTYQSGLYARTVRIAIGRSASNFIMKRRTINDKDHSVAQESARNGSLRAGWRR